MDYFLSREIKMPKLENYQKNLVMEEPEKAQVEKKAQPIREPKIYAD